jgi:hypothetical protein
MRYLGRWLVLVGAASAYLAVFSGSAAASTDLPRLLARYQPVTVMDTRESFVPTTVRAFVTDAALDAQTAPNTSALVSSNPSATSLPTTPTPACATQT